MNQGRATWSPFASAVRVHAPVGASLPSPRVGGRMIHLVQYALLVMSNLDRLTHRAPPSTPVDTDPHSRLIEIYFSILQRKAISPADLDHLAERVLAL